MSLTLTEQLASREQEQALSLSEESLTEESTLIVEGLEESLFESENFEEPVESEDVSALQFHSQDHLDGLSDEDLNSFNPDNSAALNSVAVGSGQTASSLVGQLLGESADEEEEEGDEIDLADIEEEGEEDDLFGDDEEEI